MKIMCLLTGNSHEQVTIGLIHLKRLTKKIYPRTARFYVISLHVFEFSLEGASAIPNVMCHMLSTHNSIGMAMKKKANGKLIVSFKQTKKEVAGIVHVAWCVWKNNVGRLTLRHCL